ncbi:SIR2 family protein [Vibrio jasicida]|uniref:SIR2 family protein n=1 Tax=Vibrio jasicida TaxID=766224 RepID=UPI00039B7FC2|nr:SIR2 family protein [Vibrio jasicida]
MSSFRVASKKALMSALKQSRKEIALLVGAPLSSPAKQGQKGVPGVKGVLDIIESYVDKELDLKDEYVDEVIDKYQDDTIQYQKAFEFLADYTDPDTLNLIVRKAVLQANYSNSEDYDLLDHENLLSLQNDSSSWHISETIESLAKILTSQKFKSGPVLTTNFDPLISIALRKISCESNKVVLHGDGSLEQFQSDIINIVHMHGDWIKSDTMHTQSQLRLNRPKLKTSLSNILKNKTLFVIGYGGWDDIFMQALRDLMDDDSANFNVIWAFFENEESIINNRYEKLIKSVQPAIGRNRFRIYGGINCHEFIPELSNYILNSEKSNKTICNINKKETSISNSSDDNILFRDILITTPTWDVNFNNAHQHIREVERASCFEIIQTSRVLNLVCDWGLGKDEFILSLINDTYSPILNSHLYRIDLEDVQTKEDLLDRIELSYGFGLQDFISGMSSSPSVLCLDNFDSTLRDGDKAKLLITIEWLINVVTEFNLDCKIIICSKSFLNSKTPAVKLYALEEFDVRSYISHHPAIHSKPDEHVYESLLELSQGIPALLDKYIGELEILSIDELYDAHFSPETYKNDPDRSVPNELRKRIESLLSSDETHSLRSYELVKILSVLENGDSFTNLKQANSEFNFKASHLKELYSLELVESVNVSKNFLKTTSYLGDEKIHSLPPIVRHYVYGQLTTKEVYSIVKQLANVHLGKKWQSGNLNLCAISKDMLTNIGSTHIIILHLLRCSIELNNTRGFNSALVISEAYGEYLSRNNRHRELIKFTEQIKAIIKENEKAKTSIQMDVNLGEALRMLDQDEKAEETLLYAYERLKEKEHPQKRLLKSLLDSIALLYEFNKDYDNANKFANELLAIDKNHVGARYIVASTSEHTSIQELKELEEHFRNTNNTITANNICIKLYDLEKSSKEKMKWLNKVLQSKDDQYNKFRAVTRKGSLLDRSNDIDKLNQVELKLLHSSYVYSFSQKMTSLFNSSHKELWAYYQNLGNYPVLMKLFQQSSLFWRIYDNSEKENKYSSLLSPIISGLLPRTIDLSKYKYVTFRVRQISSKATSEAI